MGLLVDLTRAAFAEGGPLHREIGLKKAYRWQQALGAERLARHLEEAEVSNDPRVRLQMNQIDTGLGKTLLTLIVLGLYSQVHGKRAIVSTFTTSLRRDIAANSDLVNRVVAETLSSADMPFRGLIVAEKKSATGYVSTTKCGWLRRRLEAGVDASEQGHLEAFLNWVGETETGEFSEWFEQSNSEGRLPLGLTEMDLCLNPGDMKEDGAGKNAYLSFREAEKEADILVLTHAMLLQNAIEFGRIVGTDKKSAERGAARPFGAIVIDEADQVPQMARTRHESMVPLNLVRHLLEEAKGNYRQLANAAESALNDLEELLVAIHNDTGFMMLSSEKLFSPVIEKVLRLYGAVVSLYLKLEQDEEIILHSLAAQVLLPLSNLVSLQTRSGSSDTEYRAIEMSDAMPVVDYRMGNENIRIGVKPRDTSFNVNRIWRSFNSQTTRSVAFMSATLRGMNGDLSTFIRDMGIGDGSYGTVRDWIDISEDIVSEDFGHIGAFVFAERDKNLLPSRPAAVGGDFDNPAYLDYIAGAIAHSARNGSVGEGVHSRRIVALFCSDRTMMKVADLLTEKGLGDRLVIQRSGRKPYSLIGDFIAKPDAIWLGLNWEGLNLVCPDTGRSLIGTLILTKIPLPVGDELRQNLSGIHKDIHLRRQDAFRRLIQGIGRGIRHPDDKIDIWILDPRFPLPPQMAEEMFLSRYLESEDGKVTMSQYGPFDDAIPARFRGEASDPLAPMPRLGYFTRQSGLSMAA